MSDPQDPNAVNDAECPLPELLERAREQTRAGRYREAVATLGVLLGRDPAHAGGNAQMVEVLYADRRIGSAGPYVDAALLKTPDSPRLHILRGEVLRARGLFDEADSVFAAVLARDPVRAGAWSGRIGTALDRRDWMGAVVHLRAGLAATGDAGLLGGAIHRLREAGAVPALFAALDLLPEPDRQDAPRYLRWLREIHRAGDDRRLARALAEMPSGWPVAMRSECHGMRAGLASADGDLPAALRERREALALQPKDRACRRLLLRALLAVGDVDAAEAELRALADSRAPQDDMAGEVEALRAARTFSPAMQSLRAAFAASDSPVPQALAGIVCDAPDCGFAAVAFLAALRRHAAAVPATGEPRIPLQCWSLESADVSWVAQHPGARWQALGYAPLPADIRAALPVPEREMHALPWDRQVDLLRVATLWRAGGWWIPAQRHCHGNLPAQAGADTSLFLVCDADGWLSPDCLGSCAGDAALAGTADLLARALRRPAAVPGSGSEVSRRYQTARDVLTLGVARALAGRVMRGDRLADVRILNIAALRRAVT